MIKRTSYYNVWLSLDIVYTKNKKNMKVTTWLKPVTERYLYMILQLNYTGMMELFNVVIR